MKKFIWVGLVIVLLAGGYLGYTRFQSAQKAATPFANLETVSLEQGSLVSTVSAIGRVRSKQSANISWETSGSVESVEFALGDKVKTGDVLARLSQTSLPQSVILAQADLVNAQQALEDLQENATAAKIAAMQDIVTFEQAVRDAQYQLDNYTIPINQQNLDAIAAVDIMRERLDQARQAFEPYKYRSPGDSKRKELLEALNEAQGDYNAAVKRLQYEYDLEVAQANLDKARKDYDKWKNGPVLSEIDAANAKIAASRATLSQAWIAAPISGTITQANPLVGDQVTANTLAFRIDDLTTLYVDLQVSEIDVHQVQIGQDVSLTFDAIREKTYQGSVVQVAMIGSENQDVVDFTVTIELKNPDGNVLPGMTSEVEIVVAERQNVLMIPNQAIQIENGKQVVYVLKPPEGMVPVEVTLGIASDTHSELLAGELQVGDQIVLNPSGSSEDQSFGPGGGFFRRNPGGQRPEDGEGSQP